ncbi:MAG: UDP-glucose 4-epimerase, partial [Acidimicrobiaceae bacterium]|nr:UDP-glucose 4-epimerase [Acidimicrobiaceae bacterium]
MGKRVLVTGLGTFWGGRVAQALERDPSVEMIVGLDTEEPKVELERTEYVRADQNYSILARIVRATQVDTILHTFLVVDSTRMSGRKLHEVNVIGTMNLLAAASAPDSSVRHLVVKSSTLIYGSSYQDPAWFREDMSRVGPPNTRVERSLLEVEGYLRDFAEDNPHVTVSLLRFANVLGTDIVTPISTALSLPMTPAIFGFDPLMQFVEEDDVVRSIEFVLARELPGVYNVAGDGRLPWSEVA